MKGYRVNEAGEILNPTGKKLKGYYSNKKYKRFKYDRNISDLEVHRLAAYQWFGEELYKPGIEVRQFSK